jgi:hypothetical protein
MVGFAADAAKFVFFWLAVYLSCMSMAYLGMLVVCVTPNIEMGITAGATTLVSSLHEALSWSWASASSKGYMYAGDLVLVRWVHGSCPGAARLVEMVLLPVSAVLDNVRYCR